MLFVWKRTNRFFYLRTNQVLVMENTIEQYPVRTWWYRLTGIGWYPVWTRWYLWYLNLRRYLWNIIPSKQDTILWHSGLVMWRLYKRSQGGDTKCPIPILMGTRTSPDASPRRDSREIEPMRKPNHISLSLRAGLIVSSATGYKCVPCHLIAREYNSKPLTP